MYIKICTTDGFTCIRIYRPQVYCLANKKKKKKISASFRPSYISPRCYDGRPDYSKLIYAKLSAFKETRKKRPRSGKKILRAAKRGRLYPTRVCPLSLSIPLCPRWILINEVPGTLYFSFFFLGRQSRGRKSRYIRGRAIVREGDKKINQLQSGDRTRSHVRGWQF